MSDLTPCCRRLESGIDRKSPFRTILALGWYDGPTEGLARCGGCGREYHFRTIDGPFNDDDGLDVRIFAFEPIPEGSLSRLETALTPYQEPRRPVWVPLWSFPTVAEKEALDRLVDEIVGAAGAPSWVAATTDLAGEFIASRGFPSSAVTDWFAYLGIVRADVEA